MPTSSEIVQFFCKHLVALNVSWELVDGANGATAVTCFVLEVQGRWFLVTAGHVLEGLFKALPRCRRVESSLFDGWHDRAHRTPLPFSLRDAEHIELDEDGLDVGLVVLHPMYRRMLEANGITAFNERSWRDPPRDLEAHVLLGLPEQFIERTVSQAGTEAVHVSPTLVTLHAVPPPSGREKAFPCFYGKVPEPIPNPDTGETLTGMVGFSGGPILGFRTNDAGAMRYYLVAIQAAWWPDLRVVNGPLASVIAAGLAAHLQQP